MTHVICLGMLAGEPPAPGGPDRARMTELAAHGVDSLQGALRDAQHQGWYAAVGPDGPVNDAKQAYGHAFVVLAATSARVAGIEGADDLLTDALSVQDRYFWDEAAGLVVEEWDSGWAHLDPYRGVNANMHTVDLLDR